jgi:hypothetical protein
MFEGQPWRVPKSSLAEFLQSQGQDSPNAYEVRSAVPLRVFQEFLQFLTTRQKPSITDENAFSLSMLAKEFQFSEFATECDRFLINSPSAFLEAIAALKAQISSPKSPLLVFEDKLRTQEGVLEGISGEARKLSGDLQALQGQMKSTEDLVNRIGAEAQRLLDEIVPLEPPSLNPEPSPEAPSSDQQHSEPPPRRGRRGGKRGGRRVAKPVPPLKAWIRAGLLMKYPGSMDGVIAFLTKRHGGNVHERGIVLLSAHSVARGSDVKHVADLDSYSAFRSSEACNPWLCWDFQERRVELADYTIRPGDGGLQSYVIEGSMDGASWTELDRSKAKAVLPAYKPVSFAIATSAECRFVRLTRVAAGRWDDGALNLEAVEFFGVLLE